LEMEGIGLSRKKPEMIRVMYMLFLFYVVQAILQKKLVLSKNAVVGGREWASRHVLEEAGTFTNRH
jgi:hypothetical protein